MAGVATLAGDQGRNQLRSEFVLSQMFGNTVFARMAWALGSQKNQDRRPGAAECHAKNPHRPSQLLDRR